MVRYDEKSFAEEMHKKQSFIKSFCNSELEIYAKWLKYNEIMRLKGEYTFDLTDEEIGKIDSVVEASLIDFSSKHYGVFNYNLHYKKIDDAMENTREFRLKLPLPINITKKEWETILQDDDETERRVLLVSLIDVKYNLYHNASLKTNHDITKYKNYYTTADEADLIKIAGVKVPKDKRDYFFSNLKDKGYCEVTTGSKNFISLHFVDIDPDSEVFYEVKNYDCLDLYYDKFIMPDSIGVCEYCGKLFRQNKNRTIKFCYKHRGYNKVDLKKLICIDCGNEFFVSPSNNTKVRCNNCQAIKRRKDVSNNMKKYRKNQMLSDVLKDEIV